MVLEIPLKRVTQIVQMSNYRHIIFEANAPSDQHPPPSSSDSTPPPSSSCDKPSGSTDGTPGNSTDKDGKDVRGRNWQKVLPKTGSETSILR